MKLALVAIAIIFLACFAQADNINVCPNGCKYKTIQSAVHAAKTNDTIVVSSGTYNESVFLTKALKFIKNESDKSEPVINGNLYTENFKYSLKGFGFDSVYKDPDPESVDFNTADYWIGAARNYYSYDASKKAFNAISNALEIDPQNVIALNLRGLILSDQGRTEEALDSYKQAIAIDPFFDSAHFNMGVRLSSESDYEGALTCFDNAIKANPKSEDSFSWKSIILYRLGEYDDALAAINEAIRLDPQDDTNWKIRSDVLFQQGKYNDALESIDKSIELSPSEADYWKKKGTILQKMGPSYETDAKDALAYAKELSN